MDQSRALHQLLESADLIGMIEDLSDPTRVQSLGAGSLSGMRITLRNVREAILSSHDTLAAQLVSSAKGQVAQKSEPSKGDRAKALAARVEASKQSAATKSQDSEITRTRIARKDLKASLERYVE